MAEREPEKGVKKIDKTMSAGQLRRLGMEVDPTVPDRASAPVLVTILVTIDPPKIRYDYELSGPFQWTNEWPADWPGNKPLLATEERANGTE